MKISHMFFIIIICVGMLSGIEASRSEASNIILENSRTQTLNCDEKSYHVFGNKNQLTFTGNCDKISVQGNWNVVSIETVKTIQVTGNSNQVKWGRAVSGSEPEILNTGSGNTILTKSQGSSSEKSANQNANESPQIQIQKQEGSESKQVDISGSKITVKRGGQSSGSGSTSQDESSVSITDSEVSAKSGSKIYRIVQDNEYKKIDCGQGWSLVISGDRNTIKIVGQCAELALTGDGNNVTINLVSKIKVTGDRNEVYWKQTSADEGPEITDTGSSNTIERLQ